MTFLHVLEKWLETLLWYMTSNEILRITQIMTEGQIKQLWCKSLSHPNMLCENCKVQSQTLNNVVFVIPRCKKNIYIYINVCMYVYIHTYIYIYYSRMMWLVHLRTNPATPSLCLQVLLVSTHLINLFLCCHLVLKNATTNLKQMQQTTFCHIHIINESIRLINFGLTN